MKEKNQLVSLVEKGQLTPTEAVVRFNKHSTRLNDINIDFISRPLKCGLPTIEKYEYILANEGNLVVMAARPGNGKTALACQIGIEVAKHGRTLLFSLEMRKEALAKRLTSVLSGVAIKKLGLPVNSDRVSRAMRDLSTYRFDIVDTPGLTVDEILTKTYDEYRNEPIDLVIVDYIGIVKVNNELRATGMGEVAKRLKRDLADRLKIPVLVLAQMNRSFDARQASAGEDEEVRPNLADIGESSGIEHAADVVMFLHRPCLVDNTKPANLFKVYVSKNRNGEVKDFNLDFSDELTKFIDYGK